MRDWLNQVIGNIKSKILQLIRPDDELLPDSLPESAPVDAENPLDEIALTRVSNSALFVHVKPVPTDYHPLQQEDDNTSESAKSDESALIELDSSDEEPLLFGEIKTSSILHQEREGRQATSSSLLLSPHNTGSTYGAITVAPTINARPDEASYDDIDFLQNENLRHFMVPGRSGVPFSDGARKQFAIWCQSFFNISKMTMRDLIPTGFTALLLHDVICYQLYPHQRYGTDIFDIFLGSASNEQGWSSHMGSYERGQVSPIAWPFIYMATPLLFSVVASLAAYRFPDELGRKTRDIVWGQNAVKEKQALLSELIEQVKQGGRPALAGLFSLTAIAVSFDNANLAHFSLKDEQKAALSLLRRQAVSALQAQSGLLASYLSWRAGVNRSRFAPLYWAPTLLWLSYALYANARYGEVFVRKIIDLANYLDARNACEANQNHYLWTDATADYECSACGDWPFVSYRESLTADGCLQMLLSQPVPPQTLVTYCQQLGENRRVTALDFSAQPWYNWSEEELASVFNALQKVCKSGVQSLRFSTTAFDFTPPLSQMRLIAAFINQLQPLQVNLGAMRLQEAQLSAWFDAIQSPNAIVQLRLDDNPLDEEGAACVATGLAKLPQLQQLSLAGTHLPDSGLARLAAGIVANPGVSELDISNNALSESGLLALMVNWRNSSIESLNASANPMNSQAIAGMANAMLSRPLRALSLANCKLKDEGLLALAPGVAMLERLSLANNEVTYLGLHYFIQTANFSALQFFDLSFNQVTDAGMLSLGEMLSQGNLTELRLSGNLLSPQGLHRLMPYLAKSQLETFILENIFLGDDAARLFAQEFKNKTLSILHLSLAGTGLTNEGMDALRDADTGLTQLTLARNLIDARIRQSMRLFIDSNPQLETLNMANNRLNGTFIQKFGRDLHASKLANLNLDGNAIDARSALVFASELIAPVPAGVELSDPQISLDARRALMRAKPTTHLSHIDLGDMPSNSEVKTAFNRLNTAFDLQWELHNSGSAPSAALSRYGFYRHSPAIRPLADAPAATHPAAAGLMLSPFALSLIIGLGVVGVIILASLLYRAAAKSYEYCRSGQQKPDELPSLDT